MKERKEQGKVLMELWKKGELPTRVTHNDTKLNNVLLDADTKEGICVIDLDTVMPGLSAFDFGDSIRFGACTGAEDETDLSCISCDLDLFERSCGRLSSGMRGQSHRKRNPGASSGSLDDGI